jgi:hypothetical protein
MTQVNLPNFKKGDKITFLDSPESFVINHVSKVIANNGNQIVVYISDNIVKSQLYLIYNIGKKDFLKRDNISVDTSNIRVNGNPVQFSVQSIEKAKLTPEQAKNKYLKYKLKYLELKR